MPKKKKKKTQTETWLVSYASDDEVPRKENLWFPDLLLVYHFIINVNITSTHDSYN